jgi:hypothetical protein
MKVFGKFELSIELGNEAMLGDDDIADALEKVAKRLRDNAYTAANVQEDITRVILDYNGNGVGEWSLTWDDE